jgi:hypothetical protein
MKRFMMRLLLGLALISMLGSCGTPSGQSLPFTTAVEVSDFARNGFEPARGPILMIIASPQEVKTFTQEMNTLAQEQRDYTQIVEGLQKVDFERAFVVLVRQGTEDEFSGNTVTIEKITRRDDHVTIEAASAHPQLSHPVMHDSSHIVAVTKEGSWDASLSFNLVFGDKATSNTVHMIP